MPKTMPQTATLPRFTRMTRNNQVTLPKNLTEPDGIGLGSLFQVEKLPEGYLLRPVSPVPIAEAPATAAELRAFKRGRAEAAAGKTMPYAQYRTKRAAPLDRQRGPKRAKRAR